MGKNTFNHIAILVRKAREANGISQWELSQKIGYKNSQYISNLERSVCSVPAKKMPMLAKVLNVKLEEIREAHINDVRENIDRIMHESLIEQNLILNESGRVKDLDL